MAKAKKSPFPDRISPMLATMIAKPFTDPDWVYEIKWDGYRIIAYVQGGMVRLYSRGAQDYTQKYLPIANELAGMEDCVIDGEIVVLDENGHPDFSALQNYQGTGDIVYYIFDLLYYQGESYLNKTLLERKEMLLHIITKEHMLSYSDHFPDGVKLYEQLHALALEGIMAKKKDSLYHPGARSKEWLKIKMNSRREYVIGGWSESGKTSLFKSILFGEYRDGKLYYVHHSGGGHTSKQKSELNKQFKELEIQKCPFVNPKDVIIGTKPHWVKPVLVAEFEISNQTTKTGIIRHPAIYKGLRTDKKADEVVEEVPVSMEVSVKKGNVAKVKPQTKSPAGSYWPEIEARPITSQEQFEVDGKDLSLTNIERHVWKDVTKAELIQYYISIADYILPYLKDRPLGLNVSLYDPLETIFIRNMEGRHPSWAEIFTTERKHKKAGKSHDIDWILCNDLATLVYLVNLDSIDLHPWNSRTTNPDFPDYIAIDLDPSDDDFEKVIQTALAAKQLCDKHKLKVFVKTSGKSGMHLFIPCEGIPFGQARTVAENICEWVHRLVPQITTLSTSVNSRGNKLYIDPSQNDYADRVACAYCVRACKEPRVSAPLDWKEVNMKLDPGKLNINTMMDRIKKKGDIWADLLDKKIAAKNAKALKAFY